MKNKLIKFMQVLDDYGECFFTNGSVKKDYEFVSGILKAQGYWAGISYRFYFDDKMNLVDVVNRW